MKRIVLVLASATLTSILWVLPAGGQELRPAGVLSLAQTERSAVDLKQGMSAEEVQKLLGKPRRTALTSPGSYPNTTSQGILQWSYSWTGSRGKLNIDFVAKAPDQWYVNNWEWTIY
jgi:hypothetical protein